MHKNLQFAAILFQNCIKYNTSGEFSRNRYAQPRGNNKIRVQFFDVSEGALNSHLKNPSIIPATA